MRHAIGTNRNRLAQLERIRSNPAIDGQAIFERDRAWNHGSGTSSRTTSHAGSANLIDVDPYALTPLKCSPDVLS
jgi:hypothetical protein